MVLLSRAGFKRIWRHLMQRHCARRTIAVWHQSTTRATENRRHTLIYITTAPHAFESLWRYFDVICWSAWCCSKSNTPIHRADPPYTEGRIYKCVSSILSSQHQHPPPPTAPTATQFSVGPQKSRIGTAYTFRPLLELQSANSTTSYEK